MDVLEKEILKYEKKGFKIDHKRTLKHGLRKVLFKKGGWLGTDTLIYFYYVDGDASTDSFREFFKDYAKFYEDKNMDPEDGDRGFFVSSGYANEKDFKALKAMIRDDDASNSVKLLKTGKTPESVDEDMEKTSTLPYEETERIIHRVGTICCYPNCKETIALDVHHIVPRREGGTNKDSNLIVLCPSHHRLADRGAIPRRRLEMYSVEKMEMGKKQA